MSNKPKILLVDDESTNLKLLRSILQDEYELVYAKNGQTAIGLAHDVDLILLDIMMPEMDGYEVCRYLKSHEESQEIPIIFVTAMGTMADELKGFELGAVDYITKPVSGPIVHARVKTHLALRSAYRKLKEQNHSLLEAEKLKQDVDHIVRHDMKTPLNGVIGFVDVLINDETMVVEQRREFLKIVQDSAYKALHMVNLSLGIFRMEKGDYQLTPVEVDLLPLLHRVLADIKSQITNKKLIQILELNNAPVKETDHFPVFGEELLCYSMFANLIKNAVEASPREGNLTISMRREQSMTFVEIHNRGTVPEAIRARFFEKYVTSGKQHGTGLGTYSAKLIAQTQGGDLSMTSSEGEGTCITVQLPLSTNQEHTGNV